MTGFDEGTNRVVEKHLTYPAVKTGHRISVSRHFFNLKKQRSDAKVKIVRDMRLMKKTEKTQQRELSHKVDIPVTFFFYARMVFCRFPLRTHQKLHTSRRNEWIGLIRF
jgi:hypothetical protein